MKKFLFPLLVLLSNQLSAQVNLGLGLVAHYPFSGTVNDASGNNNNPIFNNTIFTADRFGNPNSAVYFNGINNYIRIPNTASLQPQEMSLCAIIKPVKFYYGLCYNNCIINKGNIEYIPGAYSLRYTQAAYTNNNCNDPDTLHQNFTGYSNGNPGPPLYTPYVVSGQWFCVVYTVGPDSVKIYVNGLLKWAALRTSTIGSNNQDVFLGKMDNANYPYWFNGVMDDIRIYNRAINQQEVNALCGVTPVNPIGGIINDYTPVISFDPCKNDLAVEDANAFTVDDTVVLIQMKGAAIDSTNTASFGTINNYNNAGNYEFNIVAGKTGNTIRLKNKVTRQYDIPVGKVQLIRVPYYPNATVVTPLTCLPWDGNKGGVLVLNVADSINLNANIDVSGKGFKGGIDPYSNPASYFCYENNFFYPPNPDLASGKGEHIGIISSLKSFGKGAPANGGGGGNSHNSGGGGGANGSAGGFGGYNFEGSPCTNTPFDNRGFGGKPLTYSNTANKIFSGGGGGAGHTNNPQAFEAKGGDGGGIAIIIANKLLSNSNKILLNGNDGIPCGTTGPPCHEGMGGGGAGGTGLLDINNYLDNATVETKGGKGADMTASGFLKVGPGGGGSGGVLWLDKPSIPANLTYVSNGGASGVATGYGNDPFGASAGSNGINLLNLQLPIDNVLFIPNIDSVRIKDSATGCSSFDFKGFGYTNTNPIVSWNWYFGDGGTANTQNTTHSYNSSGNYTVKLVVTDVNGCKDSISRNVTAIFISSAIVFKYLPCLPNTTLALGGGGNPLLGDWDFGDGNFAFGVNNVVHTYSQPGIYNIKYKVTSGGCTDSSIMIFDPTIIRDNIVLTNDTTICAGTTKQLVGVPSNNLCWSPNSYLTSTTISNPISSTPSTITYHYTAETLGSNLIPNGDFSQGNTGFISEYTFQAVNTGQTGAYGINTNAQTWYAAAGACMDHSTGAGNMFVGNGSVSPGVKAWKMVLPVTPATNYQFSGWIQSVSSGNPSGLKIYINNKPTSYGLNAPVANCQWIQERVNWNSGNNTSVEIALVNEELNATGNDFALDDLFFGPVFIKRDSVTITVDTPRVVTTPNTNLCEGRSLQLNTTGAVTYSWSPVTGLSDPTIPNPVAIPTVTTRYIVTGINNNGCTGADTVDITLLPKPSVMVSSDDTICLTNSIQLFASGGIAYSWTPAASLNNPSIANPIATPPVTTLYKVVVTGNNTCTDSSNVRIEVRSLNTFTINAPVSVCKNDSVQLSAGGGDFFSWQPASSLSNPSIANPMASPGITTTYTVNIIDTACNNNGSLTTSVTVLPLPNVRAQRSTDLYCAVKQSQLSATGAINYSWYPVQTLSDPLSASPIATPTITTIYVVQGTDVNGCVNQDSVTVMIKKEKVGGYLMPTAFTPNKDGLNDCYGIKHWGDIQNLEFSIYNRWGQRVFFTTNPTGCWDGTVAGVAQNPGVFVFMIKAKTECDPNVFQKGTFVLIR